MNKERLLKLANFLRELPPEKFDIGFTVREWEGNCGSVCCAIGWTPLLFPELVQWNKSGSLVRRLKLRDEESSSYIDVAVEIFNINYIEAARLFDADDYDDVLPCMVAEKIEKFVKEN